MAQPLPPLPPIPQPPPVPDIIIGQGGPPEVVILAGVAIVGIIVAGIVLLTLIKTVARRLEGRHADAGLAAELENLRNRVADLEESHHRLTELEERVDFSERLLTQKDPQALRAGGADAAR